MIVIDNGTRADDVSIKRSMEKYKYRNIKIDKDSIEYSISNLRKKLTRDNTIYNTSIRNIIEYLESIRDSVKDDNNICSLEFSMQDYKLVSKPFLTKKVHYFNIESTDYIDIDTEEYAVVNVEYAQLMNAVAFEMCSEDLGYSFEDMENILEDVPILGVNSGEKITDIIDNLDDFDYVKAYGCMIDKTKYASMHKKIYTDYFGDEVQSSGGYRTLLLNSFEKIMCIIVDEVTKELMAENIKMRLAGVYESSYVLVVRRKELEILTDKLSKEVAIRLFGRYFKYMPEVTSY